MLWTSLARPKSAIFMTLLSVTRTFLAARSLCIHWNGERKEGRSQSGKSEGAREIRQLAHSINKSTLKQVYTSFGMVLKCLWCM